MIQSARYQTPNQIPYGQPNQQQFNSQVQGSQNTNFMNPQQGNSRPLNLNSSPQNNHQFGHKSQIFQPNSSKGVPNIQIIPQAEEELMKNKLYYSYETLSPILKPKENKPLNNQEQEIYDPTQNNRTIIADDEVLSLDKGIANHGDNEINKRSVRPNHNLNANSVSHNLAQSHSHTIFKQNNFLAMSQHQGVPSNMGASKISEFPPLIEQFKLIDTKMATKLDEVFKINNDVTLENHLQQLRKVLAGKLKEGIDTINQIKKQENLINDKVQKAKQAVNLNEHLFNGDRIDQKLSWQDKLQKANEIIQGNRVFTSKIQEETNNQLNLCNPSNDLAHAPPDFILENWEVSSVQVLKEWRSKFEKVYSSKVVKEFVVPGTASQLKQLSQNHQFLIPRERILFIKETATKTGNQNLSTLGEYLLYLVEVDQALITTDKQLEGAVRVYQNFLMTQRDGLLTTMKNINTCEQVIKMTSKEMTDMNEITPICNKTISLGEKLPIELEQEVKSPFIKNKKENGEFLYIAEDKRIKYIKNLNKYLVNTTSKRNKIISYQKENRLPFIIITPLDQEVISKSRQAEACIKNLESLGIIVSNLKNLGPTSERAETITRCLKKLEEKNEKKKNLTQQEIDNQIMDLQEDITSLVQFRDDLGTNNISNCNNQFTHPCLKQEHERITKILALTQDYQDKLFLMQPSNQSSQNRNFKPIFDRKANPQKIEQNLEGDMAINQLDGNQLQIQLEEEEKIKRRRKGGNGFEDDDYNYDDDFNDEEYGDGDGYNNISGNGRNQQNKDNLGVDESVEFDVEGTKKILIGRIPKKKSAN